MVREEGEVVVDGEVVAELEAEELEEDVTSRLTRFQGWLFGLVLLLGDAATCGETFTLVLRGIVAGPFYTPLAIPSSQPQLKTLTLLSPSTTAILQISVLFSTNNLTKSSFLTNLGYSISHLDSIPLNLAHLTWVLQGTKSSSR